MIISETIFMMVLGTTFVAIYNQLEKRLGTFRASRNLSNPLSPLECAGQGRG
jgi:hypothetical protein